MSADQANTEALPPCGKTEDLDSERAMATDRSRSPEAPARRRPKPLCAGRGFRGCNWPGQPWGKFHITVPL